MKSWGPRGRYLTPESARDTTLCCRTEGDRIWGQTQLSVTQEGPPLWAVTLGRNPNEHISCAEIWGNRCEKENEGPGPQGGNKVSLFQKTSRRQSVISRAVSCRKNQRVRGWLSLVLKKRKKVQELTVCRMSEFPGNEKHFMFRSHLDPVTYGLGIMHLSSLLSWSLSFLIWNMGTNCF